MPVRESREERRNLGCSIWCLISSDMVTSVSGSMTKAMAEDRVKLVIVNLSDVQGTDHESTRVHN